MEELDDVVVADNPSTASLRKSLGGNDHPIVIPVLMRVTRNLLALTADSLVGVITRIALRVRVQQVLCVHVFDGDGVEVTNLFRRKPINVGLATTLKPNVPWLFINNSLPIKVSWNAGDMNVSPVPEWVRRAKWIQKKKR